MSYILLDSWKQFTISACFDELKIKNSYLFTEFSDKHIEEAFKESNFYKQIKNRFIIGSSIEGIKNVYNGENLNIYISLTEIFYESIEKSKKFAPIIYILKIIKKLLQIKSELNEKGEWNDIYWDFLGRAFKGYASLFRDFDAYLKIKKIIEEKRKIFNFINIPEQNPKLDSKGHTDILIRCENFEYKEIFRLWLYQSTSRGLANLIIRLSEFRGKLEKGYHILIPINIFLKDNKVEDIYGWKLYSNDYLKSIIEICIECFNRKISSVISYDSFKRDLLLCDRISRLVNSIDDKREKEKILEQWALGRQNALNKILDSFFIFEV